MHEFGVAYASRSFLAFALLPSISEWCHSTQLLAVHVHMHVTHFRTAELLVLALASTSSLAVHHVQEV